ncbi:MAG: ACT domain-containing protein [Candidatus Faecousia sp.]|jgi:ACT domain-containing protein|uniref:ACT domain-containing protein n=1 Tax=Faecousia sp. TaxID=2952921 RepID=UPI002A90408B|nr:ACT domain-containing protein [Candidatus Faecousia sp.]
MKAVITVVGKDSVGILAKVSAKCSENGLNIIDVTQSVMQDMFCMIMLAEIQGMQIPFGSFADEMAAMGESMGMVIHVMHEDIFNAMHRI